MSRLLRGVLGGVSFLLALLVTFELAWPPFYDFAPAQPFQGEHWYNPYAGYTGGGLLANFHAHSEAWGGLTFGNTPRRELYALYKARGYDVVGISDYMLLDSAIEPDELFVSSYEHGFTPGRHHHTVIGAEHVVWFDYPLGGSTRQKQNVLDWLRPSARFLVINHPTKAASFSIHDLERLSGYDAIEVASKYGVWDDYWDAALSAGRPIWGVASDDGHAQTEEGAGSHVGIGAILIHAAERTPEAVFAALRAGRFHSLYTRQNEPPLLLERCELEDGALRVRVGERANAIRFYGPHGVLRYQELGRAEASYAPRADDPYVRVEVIAHGAVVYLNPVLRWDGVALPKPEARVRALPTWAARGLGALSLLLIGWGIARFVRAGRQSGIRNST
ncbi:MAG TPA: hypothetical protein VMR50_06025 [Myxococcota bacterium]|nr:hypothetical protein [Myxococcota bacterium]